MKFGMIAVLLTMLLAGCAGEAEPSLGYVQITAQDAKTIMDTQSGYVILDTREQYEYDQGHIPGAILIPYGRLRRLLFSSRQCSPNGTHRTAPALPGKTLRDLPPSEPIWE